MNLFRCGGGSAGNYEVLHHQVPYNYNSVQHDNSGKIEFTLPDYYLGKRILVYFRRVDLSGSDYIKRGEAYQRFKTVNGIDLNSEDVLFWPEADDYGAAHHDTTILYVASFKTTGKNIYIEAWSTVNIDAMVLGIKQEISYPEGD